MAILGTFQSLLAPKAKSDDPARLPAKIVSDSSESTKGPDMIAMRDAFVNGPKKEEALKNLEQSTSSHGEFRTPAMFRKP